MMGLQLHLHLRGGQAKDSQRAIAVSRSHTRAFLARERAPAHTTTALGRDTGSTLYFSARWFQGMRRIKAPGAFHVYFIYSSFSFKLIIELWVHRENPNFQTRQWQHNKGHYMERVYLSESITQCRCGCSLPLFNCCSSKQSACIIMQHETL